MDEYGTKAPPEEGVEDPEEGAAIKGGWLRALLLLFSFILVQFIFQLLAVGMIYQLTGMPIASIENSLEAGNDARILLIHQCFALIGTILIVALFRSYVDRQDIVSLGLRFKARPFLMGLLLGPLMMGGCSLILYEMGYLGARWIGVDASQLLLHFVLAGAIAFKEELLLRGYVLKNLMSSMKGLFALLLTAAVFTLLHATNPNLSWIGVLNIFLAGILLGVSYLRDQELAFPIGLHLSWNLAQGSFFGFSVSGMKAFHPPVIESWTKGPAHWTGGGFGLEGSLLLSFLQILLIPLLYLIWKKLK